jgi:hypothetical protein
LVEELGDDAVVWDTVVNNGDASPIEENHGGKLRVLLP